MMTVARVMSSEYMEWAKTRSNARFNLATSGVENYPLSLLPVRIEDLELTGPGGYGYEPLQTLIAGKCDVPSGCVVAATGASMANHLAMATVIEPGDEVLIEHPAYELLVSTARYLGAEVRRFERRFEDGFRLDPSEVERAVTSRTRLIVITSLHNPSGALADEDALKEVGEIARRCGAKVLVDEVYLDMLFDQPTRSAFHLGEEFISTNSLTKVYGLSGLRCGWVLAREDLANRMWRLNDLMESNQAHVAERLSCIALTNLSEIGGRARQLLDTNRAVLNRFFDSRQDLEVVRPSYGTISFPRLKSGEVDALYRLLREKYETTVVPGRFFEMPEHFRIGIGCNEEVFRSGIERLAAALDEMRN
jgi:aspartate/methionine/tyrosine aminotransferase